MRKIGTRSSSESHYRCGANDVVLITGGMGPANASEKAKAALGLGFENMAGRKPDVALAIGLCGGLNTSLAEGDIVAYSACLSTDDDKTSLSCSNSITNSVTALLQGSGIRCECVVGITSSRIATKRSERLALAERGASVVDMESHSILQAAAAVKIPAAILRVVSDSIDRQLPDFNRALNDRGGLDGRKALKVALGSPWSTAKLLAANKRAMQRLTGALEIVLKAGCFPLSASD